MRRLAPWKMLAGVATLLLLLVATGSMAQRYIGYPYIDNRASTPAESYARGASDVIRSEGMYNLATSEAAVNMTEATRRTIENRQQWTSAYFNMREANDAYRVAQRAPRPSMEQLVRFAQAGKPQRLSPSELDTVTGRINWPRLLETDEFAQTRRQLEQLFQDWAYAGAVGAEKLDRIRDLTDAMLAELQAQVRTSRPADYVVARNFIQSLAYEAQLPAR